MYKVTASIHPHPTLAHGVEVKVIKNGFAVEEFSSVRSNLNESIAHAKQLIRNLFPQLPDGDINVHLSSSFQGN
jgi:hypothetical protein